MALIIEDGTGLNNSTSYASVAVLRDFASARGLTVPANDPAGTVLCEQFLIQAMDYLEGLNYIGKRKTTTQALSWPRSCAYTSDGTLLPDNVIPANLINAQCQLAIIAQTVPLFVVLPQGSKGAIMSESVYGAVSRTYAQATSATELKPYMPAVNNFLKELTTSFRQCVALRG